MVTFGDGPELYRRDSNPSSNRGWPIIRNVTHIHHLHMPSPPTARRISHHLPTMFPAVAPRCCSGQGFGAFQSVNTTAASRAATWGPARSSCPIRVSYMVHTQLTLLHSTLYTVAIATVPPPSHTYSTHSYLFFRSWQVFVYADMRAARSLPRPERPGGRSFGMRPGLELPRPSGAAGRVV